jgi:HD-GYP domain-containing protein (c-di-GMP phosphodiesterase class II)
MMRRSALMVCEDLFENPSKENITRSTKVVGSFVYLLMKEPQSYLLLSKLSSHDPYTLQHSVGAAVGSIILGRKIGMSNEKELLDLGLAGLLHDIGKVKVKKEIINKNGPLDEIEWEEMRQHSNEGYLLLKDHPEISERTKRAVLEHHEDKSGTGYPRGIKSAETDIFSRIVCITDIFNALTTDRTYSKARTPFDAFQLMREKLTHKIDGDLFMHLVLIYGGKIE